MVNPNEGYQRIRTTNDEGQNGQTFKLHLHNVAALSVIPTIVFMSMFFLAFTVTVEAHAGTDEAAETSVRNTHLLVSRPGLHSSW